MVCPLSDNPKIGYPKIRYTLPPCQGTGSCPLEKSVYRDENLILSRLLRQCRVDSGLTQGQFAAALKRPQSFVSDRERGSRRLDLVQLR
ncbi:helix-turn-helix transcriptional regulator, partial [Pseudomonas aeruginosa]|uniref:helix-turn-helix domain-containing protein n=1 Tax=Pseudomonas aeruginosa TaxID=287 RepID=UPI003078F7F3